MTETLDASARPAERLRDAETALRRLGYARIAPGPRHKEPGAAFWVQEAGVPRRTFPVFVPAPEGGPLAVSIGRWLEHARAQGGRSRRAIFVASSDSTADEAWRELSGRAPGPIDHEVSILVMPAPPSSDRPAHFQLRTVPPSEVLKTATGIVVGLFRRAQNDDDAGSINFEELLELLRGRFGIDVHRSLNVRTDEDALFVLYQLAQRDSYAPGEAGANLHLIVLKPSGPVGRVPWFAA